MPKVRLAAVFFLFLAASSPSGSFSSSLPSGPQVDTQASDAEILLDRSYDLAMSNTVGRLDQLRFLNTLVIYAPGITSREKVVKWATTLISLADNQNFLSDKELRPWDRMAFKKNAVVAISKVDPDLGMEEFAKLGPHPVDGQGLKPEDVRAYGARVVFLNYYRAHGHDSINRIQQESAKLVSDGAYPFHAVSLLFSDLPTTDKSAGADITNVYDTALHYYVCPANVENQDLDFFTFLQNARPIVSHDELKKGVNVFADHLTRKGCDTAVPKADLYSAVIETSKGKIKVSDQRKALLVRSFSFINEADSGLGTRLKSENAELANADAAINQFYSTYYRPDQLPRIQAEESGLQLALTNGIQKLRESNPAAALEMARSLKDQDTRTAQIAFVLPTLAQKDLQRMKQLYSQELNDLNSVKDGLQKTEATLWMTEAAYHADDPGNFQYFATKTFADSLRAFQASDSQKPVYARSGYRQLTEFVKFAAAHGIKWPLDEIQQLSNDGLRANLLMYAAVGMSHH